MSIVKIASFGYEIFVMLSVQTNTVISTSCYGLLYCSLSNLFSGLDESSPLRYTVYMALIKLAGHANLIHVLNPKLEEIRSWLTVWDVGAAKGQALLRSLYEAFTECRHRY